MGSYVTAIDEEKRKAENLAREKENQARIDTTYQNAMSEQNHAAGITENTAGLVAAETEARNLSNYNPVSFIDDNGEKQIGYVDAVRNDKDAENLSYYQQMEKFYNDQYTRAIDANNAAAAAQAARALAQIEKQKADLQESNDSLNKQLYRDYMQSKKSLPQYLAAKGYTGGMSESSRIGLDTSYEEQLGANERNLSRNFSDLDAAAVDAQYQADAAAQAANAQAEERRASYIAALRAQEREEALQKASAIGNATGDFSSLIALGYSQSEVNALKKVWIENNPELAVALGYVSSSSGGSGGGGGGYRKYTTGDPKDSENPENPEDPEENTTGAYETPMSAALKLRDAEGMKTASSYVKEMEEAGAISTSSAKEIRRTLLKEPTDPGVKASANPATDKKR